jgi:predicted Ser/Thr protein kinase
MAPEVQTTPCPHCGKHYSSNTRICPDDGSVLEHASPLIGQVGSVLDGKYRLDGFLSKGGMGAVYRGTHVMLGRTVAVKLINPELVTSPEVIRRFQREARAATTLNHQNIVGVYDLGQTSDGTLYIAMEFIDGPSLKDVIQRTRGLAPERAVMLLRQVAGALSVAHRNGIIHRDLKPHNIMLARGADGSDVVKLVDFGIAKTFDESTKLTSTGLPIGTPHYMSPEQASGAVVDARSDLYSVGVILFEMLTGKVPFDGDSTPVILIKHLREPPIAPSVQRSGGVPPALDAIALRLLQKEPADRFQSADELAAALDDIASGLPKSDGAPISAIAAARPAAAGAADVPPTIITSKHTPFGQGAGTSGAQAGSGTRIGTAIPGASAGATVPPVTAQTAVPASVTVAPAKAATLLPSQADEVIPAAVSAPVGQPASKSSSVVVLSLLVVGVIAALGAAYYLNTLAGKPSSTQVATAVPSTPAASAPAQSAPAPNPPSPAAGAVSGSASSASAPPTPAEAPAAPASSTSASSAPPASPSAASPAAPATAPRAERGTAPPSPPSRSGATAASSSQPPSGAAQASKAPASAASPAGRSGATESARPRSAAEPAPAPPAAAAVPAPAARGGATAPRREEPAQAAAGFPAKPAVYFRCTGPMEICNPLRSAVDEALEGAGMTSVRRANAADVDVSAQVEVVQTNVDRQFGQTFATRNYSVVLSGETTKTGEVVSMPAIANLSFDPRVGSERAVERSRLISSRLVERVQEFAAAKQRGR